MGNPNIPNEEAVRRLQQQIASMSNEEILPLLTQIMQAAGANPYVIRMGNINIDRLRRQIGAMSPRDVRQLAATIKPEALQIILEQLGNTGSSEPQQGDNR